MRIASLLLASLVTIAIAACGGGSSASSSTSSTTPRPADDSSCPVAVPGTSVTVEDTDRGAALVFVTTGDVAELRKRVAAMMSMHNEHHAAMGPLPTGDEASGGHDMSGHDMSGHDMSGHDMGGHDMGGQPHGEATGGEHAGHAGGMQMVHSQAAVEEIDGGARLVLTAMPDDVAALQAQLREHAQQMSGGTCAMGNH